VVTVVTVAMDTAGNLKYAFHIFFSCFFFFF
jgi:hypothetical protein